jgi:hypothetical protein
MKIFFSGQWLNRYLKEICYAFQEISSSKLLHTLQLIEILIRKNTQEFSEQIIRIILQSIVHAHTNDLKSLFKLLSCILLVEDSLQKKRLQLTFEGIEISNNDNCQNFNGLYSLIRTSIETEQRRAYQTVKFLINLSNK